MLDYYYHAFDETAEGAMIQYPPPPVAADAIDYAI
jgi:hypothetical protein